MRRAILSWAVLCLVALALAGCGKSPLSLLTGGGLNVAANVQAGKTNAQVIGPASFSEQKLVNAQARSIEQSTGETQVRVETAENVVVNEGPSPLFLLVGLLGWLLPSPTAMTRWVWYRRREV
jgi:hypothetical protein